MKKMSSFFLSLALITLLAACSPQDTPPENHETHEGHQDISKEQNDTHGGHGDHGDSKEEIKTNVVWRLEKGNAKEAASLEIQVQDEQGKNIEAFDINHEKLMHLILVSKDLSYFNHIHPEYTENGQFHVQNEFPAGGEYKAFADFIPANGTQQVKSEWLKIGGDSLPDQPLVAESNLTKVVDGKEVTLTFDELKPNQDVTMTFTISDAASKQPISNLEPYLGAVGHVVALDRNVETYLHVHPIDEQAKGPEAEFMTTFPSSGVYKLWGQFQHEGKVFTVPFVIEVP